MRRCSWTHAWAGVMAGLAFALGASLALEAADAQAPAGQPPVTTPSAAPPPAASSPADAPSPADTSSPSPPPPASSSSPTATELDGPAPRTTAGTGGSMQSGLAGCAVWTDRCVICQRDSGVIACSNIGIACQPQPMVCLRPEVAPEKKPGQ